jgi:hypothetical protein
MKAKLKFNESVIFATLVFVVMMAMFIILPSVSYAETGTLGKESPEIYCIYQQNGEKVDGNELTAGTYDVSFVLTGMKSLSVIEVTATYDAEQVTVASTPSALISDNSSAGFDSMGYILSNGNIVFGFVSTDEACSDVNQDEQIIATVEMTFASDCDAEQYITVSENPNLTFALADYGDGYDNSYALVDSYADYNGSLYLMTCDVTPGAGNTVTGSLVVMTDSKGSTTGVPVYGEYTVSVYSDEERTNLVTSVTSKETVDEDNNKINSFSIENLKSGTYYVTISSKYAISRNGTIVVGNSDIKAEAIPLIACNFNEDAGITVADAVAIYSNAAGDQNPYCNLNGDSGVTVADAAIVYACAIGDPSYADFIIE